jgi:hypothetical protein
MAKGKPRARVWRTTVDEKLAEDLFRVVRSRLARGIDEFWDRSGEWGREREIIVSPKDYAQKMHIPPGKEPPWAALQEGQVYLAGEFVSVPAEDAEQGAEAEPARFRLAPGKESFLRIDQLTTFKDSVKAIYYQVLRR